MKKARRTFGVVLALVGNLLLAACGGGGGGSAPMGTLGVSLTDSPACGFDQVNVTVSRIRVHQSSTASAGDAGWTDINLDPSRKINLLDLNNGVLEGLGETPLLAGHYTQVRLVLDPNTGSAIANSVVVSGGTTETPLITPSAVQSGIKLIHEFDVGEGQRTDLLLDFDACKSIVTTGGGKFMLKPVVRVIPYELNGITGFVDPSLSGVTVMAEQNGEVVRSTAPSAKTGRFVLGRLDPGDYDVVITANDRATTVIAAVPVATTSSLTTVSDSTNPISLAASTTHAISGTATLNPPNANVVAYVAAQQTFSSGTTVTVASQSADLTTGAYSLTLPTGAPSFGQYTVTLPIALSADSAVAGHYTAVASADGYTSQSASEDISAGDATNQDFTLVP